MATTSMDNNNKMGSVADQATKAGKNVLNKTKNSSESLMGEITEILTTVSDMGRHFVDGMKGSSDKALSNITSSFKNVEKSVQRKPWTFVLTAAVTGIAIGYVLGHRGGNLVDKAKDNLDLDSIH
jgi:ElaB/YqjD/DUF883 family membrane-anchored ribosome-binding protein